MTEDELMGLVILSVYGIILIIIAISALLTVIGNWRLFEKAGQNGWYAIIPFYGGFIKHKITFGEANKWLYFISWVFAIYYAYTHFCYVRAFGGSKGLAVLSLFFPGITTLILAFDKLYHEKNYHVVPHIIN